VLLYLADRSNNF